MASKKKSWIDGLLVKFSGIKTLKDKSSKEIEKNDKKEKGLSVKPKPKKK